MHVQGTQFHGNSTHIFRNPQPKFLRVTLDKSDCQIPSTCFPHLDDWGLDEGCANERLLESISKNAAKIKPSEWWQVKIIPLKILQREASDLCRTNPPSGTLAQLGMCLFTCTSNDIHPGQVWRDHCGGGCQVFPVISFKFSEMRI